MGFGGISIWQLLIVLAIVVLLFGTKKLRGIGGDLGGALKSFKKAIGNEDDAPDADTKQDANGDVKKVAEEAGETLKESVKESKKAK